FSEGKKTKNKLETMLCKFQNTVSLRADILSTVTAQIHDISRHMWRNSCAKQLMKPAGRALGEERRRTDGGAVTPRGDQENVKAERKTGSKGHSLERMTDGEKLVKC
ncbi:Hypothetical predicted protein, partial [Xyrichtys novacula]